MSSPITNKAESCSSSITTQRVHQVLVTVIFPKLERADPESIRKFVNVYDQYVNEVTARACQLGSDVMSNKALRPVDLKFCVGIELIKSCIALGLITDATYYDDLSNEVLRDYLDK